MDRPAQASDGIPFPRFTTLVLVAALALAAWILWDVSGGERRHDRAPEKHALTDSSAPPLQRVQAVDRWASLGREAIPELTEALKAQDVKTRELALLALMQIGPDARETGPAVARRLADSSEEVCATALETLRRIDHPLEQELPAIVALLSAGDGSLRDDAARALERIGAPAIPLLCDALDSMKPEARKHAAALLGRLGEDDPQTIAAIHRAASDPDDQVRDLAYRILIFWNELTLEEAVAGLRDANPKIASDPRTADRLGSDAEILVPDLIRLLGRDDTKFPALLGLWALGPAAESAIPHVVPMLETEPRPELVLDVLGKIGAGRAELAPHVLPFLVERPTYGYASERAGAALARISPAAARAAVPELVQYLRGDDSEKRRLAAAALKGLGLEAREAVPALIEALTGPDEWVRLDAAQTLGRIGPQAAAAVPELLARARDQSLSRRGQNGHRTVDSILRDAAIRDLGEIGAEPDAVVPALVQALADADEFVCTEAALALGRLRADPEAVVPALESLLLSDHDQARKAAAFALGEYGPKARSAVPILIGMTEESEDARLASTPAIEPFFVESAWSRESYRNDFPLAPLYRRSEASFATEALQKIDPDALRSAGIESASP